MPPKRPWDLFVQPLAGKLWVALRGPEGLQRLWIHDLQEVAIGAIYRARVTQVVKNIDAAFLDLGHQQVGFLNRANATKGHLLRDTPPQTNLSSILKPGRSLLVQIKRLGSGDKKPEVSTAITLTGFGVVVVGDADVLRFSKKFIGDKQPLKAALQPILTKERNLGLIVRSAAQEMTTQAVVAEAQTLIKKLQELRAISDQGPCACLDESEAHPLETILRDHHTLLGQVQIADSELYQKVATALAGLPSASEIRLHHHLNPATLFHHHSLWREVEQARQQRYWLKSGAWLDFSHTEGMTVVDVNSGKNSSHKAKQTNNLKINLEAAKALASQIPLRNLSGLIALDFINMTSKQHQRELEKQLVAGFKSDDAKVVWTPMNVLGVVMLAREARGKNLRQCLGAPCPVCKAPHGTVAPIWAAAQLEIQLRAQLDEAHHSATLACGSVLYDYLAQLSDWLPQLERVTDSQLRLEKDQDLKALGFDIRI